MTSHSIHFAFYLVFVVFLPRVTFALPGGTESILGDVTLASTAKDLQITASDGAILHHLSFDIAADESVRFIQPGTDARVLNRILGEEPTRIDGRLSGNGHVYFVNPAGILFGEGAVVEVSKLHAIAGALADQDFINGVDRYTALSGAIQNMGSITAEEVVLAGYTLSNSGRIVAQEGLVVLAAGSGLEIASANDSISVSLESPAAGGEGAGALLVVGDLAGQALLQSGVVEASRLEVHASTMVLSGQASAQEVNVGNFSSIVQTAGSMDADILSLEGGSGSTDAPTVDMPSTSNRIADLRPSGTFEKLAVRGGNSMQVSSSTLNAQAVDLRVYQGDLTLSTPFSPHSADLDSSLLLAAQGNLILGFDLDNLNFLQRIFYGRNLSAGASPEVNLELDSLVNLDAVSFGIDDLDASLSPSFVRALAKDNPTFADFLSTGFVSQASEPVSSEAIASFSTPSSTPSSPPSSELGSPPSAEPGPSPYTGLVSGTGGLLELSTMSDPQLEFLLNLGLFSEQSYFLEVLSTEAAFSRELETAGGVSSVFGGSYAVVAGDSTAGSSSGGGSSEDGGTSEDDGGDAADEGEGGEGEGGADEASAAAKAAAAIPFAPISRPVLSPVANRLLDQALSDKVEAGLNKFLDGATHPFRQDGAFSVAPNTPNAFIRESQGAVQLYDPARGAFVPAVPGLVVDRPMLFVTPADSAIVFSCVGSIAGRVSGNSRVVLAPAEGGTYEARLRRGTMAVLLDPARPPNSPGFAVRTAQGVTSATGTFFAVTEYKGQTYGKVKQGAVKRKVTPPGQPDFAAYLSKPKPKPKPPSKN